MQQLTRESFQLNAGMNAAMTERFNVSGALLVKLFGRPTQEVGRVRRAGRPGARHRRQQRDVRPHLLRRPGPARRGRHRGRLLARRPAGDQRGHHPRHARRPRRLRAAHLHAAHPADQRPGRPHDRVRLLRAGLRGARRAPRHRGARPAPTTSSTHRVASSSTTCGSATRRRRRVSIASLEGDGTERRSTTSRRRGSCAASPSRRARADGRPGRPDRRGQDHAVACSSPASTT